MISTAPGVCRLMLNVILDRRQWRRTLGGPRPVEVDGHIVDRGTAARPANRPVRTG